MAPPEPGPDPDDRPRIAVSLGDPRGIGPEVVTAALRMGELQRGVRFSVFGPETYLEALPEEGIHRVPAGSWDEGAGRDGSPEQDRRAGRCALAALDAATDAVLDGEADALVTAPVSKAALAATGFDHPGHTEYLRERAGVREVTMIMAAESTLLGKHPTLGGPLRIALLTAHVPLREVPGALSVDGALLRTRIAARALREWWGVPVPRIAFAGVNPHAGEGGLLGEEERRVLEPVARALEEEGRVVVDGIHPADTVFRRCLAGDVDLVVVPYHDVGLAVLKTLALEQGVNVTAGLPFPRTSPDHGTAFDIAGEGKADPRSMIAALRLAARFAVRGRVEAT